jgi:hypothetical protein
MVMVMDEALHEFTVTGAPLKVTTLLPCDAPKFEPVTTTCVPTGPLVGEMLEMLGAGTETVEIETLSKVAVASIELLSLLTASPMYTFCAMGIVCVGPTCVQFTPSGEPKPLKLLPLRTTFTQ